MFVGIESLLPSNEEVCGDRTSVFVPRGRSKWVVRVDNVQGPRRSRGPQPLVLGPLTVPCPWAPDGTATPVNRL